MTLTKEQFDELLGIAACLANTQRVCMRDTQDGSAISLKELQKFGTDILNILDPTGG